MKRYGLFDQLDKHANIVKPLGYFEFLRLISDASKILTDSGGIQKEAYILGVPCITFRENTEWVETVEDGWNVLVGADKNTIVEMTNEFDPKSEQRNVFGDGKAGKKIVETLEKIN